MLLMIQNACLRLTVDTLGAQMMSLVSTDHIEYLWQGDAKYWEDRSPVLFPFVGRLTDESYLYNGKIYTMEIHGFAAACEFAVVEHQADSIKLILKSNDFTMAQYPLSFSFAVTYTLKENSVVVTYLVENHDSKVMPFGLGGHPGINVPLLPDENFEDYVLEFSHPCKPNRIGFTSSVFLDGHDYLYPLEDDKRLRLHHRLFDDDAVALKNTSREVSLYSQASGRGVRVTFPDIPYIGFWHTNKEDAPFVCIEPWLSLPARQDIIEDISCRSDLIQLESSGRYTTTWTMTLL